MMFMNEVKERRETVISQSLKPRMRTSADQASQRFSPRVASADTRSSLDTSITASSAGACSSTDSVCPESESARRVRGGPIGASEVLNEVSARARALSARSASTSGATRSTSPESSTLPSPMTSWV
jgi:hypothetical protein